jgi:tRNA acetyltransferase TAN1
MSEFNLIVSTYRFREEDAQDEILELLEMFGDSDAESEITEIKGIILAKTSIDPVILISKLKELIRSEPWRVRYILRVLPVQAVVPTDLESIGNATKILSEVITTDDTFRVTVEKRHSALDSTQIISAVAGQIQRKVDLENPEWIILVEILAAQTGISVIKPDQTFSSVIEKRR